MKRHLTLAVGALLVLSSAAAVAAPFDERLDADDLRQRAEAILDGAAYTGERDNFLTDNAIVRFIEDVRERITRALAAVWERIVEWLFPSGTEDPAAPTSTTDPRRPSFGLLLLIAVGVIAVLVARSIAKGRMRFETEEERRTQVDERGDAAGLERLAAEAAEQGRYDDAVRLQFRAGLLRLDDLEVIDFEPTIPTGAVRTAVRLTEFDDVAAQFERVAYSDYEASSDDLPAQATGWRAILGRLQARDDV